MRGKSILSVGARRRVAGGILLQQDSTGKGWHVLKVSGDDLLEEVGVFPTEPMAEAAARQALGLEQAPPRGRLAFDHFDEDD
jgi:hypothetical protein